MSDTTSGPESPQELFSSARIIVDMTDGTRWETCAPLAKMPDGKFLPILGLHWSTDGKLISILLAESNWVEHPATKALAFYWPSYMPLSHDQETVQ